jgi:PAB1-binding protein PBP1
MSISQRKPLAALAAAATALTLALPVAGASAATTTPVVPAFSFGLMPGSLPCQILVAQIRLAAQFGNPLLANVLSNVFVYSGCGGAAI